LYKVVALVPAAGQGRRMGTEEPKQFLLLADKPVVVHALLRLEASPSVGEICLIVPEERVEFCRQEIVQRYKLKKVVRVVSGGPERQDSVYAGLRSLEGEVDLVVVHDGVRPFIDILLLERMLSIAAAQGACIAGLPCINTIKQVDGEGYVERTLPRQSLWQIHTPQVFRYHLLKHALEQARQDNFYATDEAALAERLGHPVRIVEDSPYNIKITSPADLSIAEAYLTVLKGKGVPT